MEVISKRSILVTAIVLFAAVISLFRVLPAANLTKSLIHGVQNKHGFSAPQHNIWSELDAVEADQVYAFAISEFPHLNLTKHARSTMENAIYIVETLRPNKTDAVSYLQGGDVPERWAKLVLAEVIDGEPYLVYYAVGPLPITQQSRIEPLTYPFNSGRNKVHMPMLDFAAINQYGIRLGQNISDITETLLNGTTDPSDPDGLIFFPRTTLVDSEGLVMWFQYFRPGMGSGGRTLLPQGLYVKVDATSVNSTDWIVRQLFYNGLLYDTVDELRADIAELGFKKSPPNLDGAWTETEDFDAAPPGRELPPPVSIQPHGPRYRLDREQRFISWFGFEFYITTAQATGVSLFDIRFKGERVMYELGLQEAMAHYAGDDPMAGGQEFFDTFFGMGKAMFELLPGYDCPAYADFLDVQYHMTGDVHELPNSICIFEFTADSLLSRHTAQYSVTASRNTYLAIRSTSTVGNYDYAIDYLFYLDGTLEVKVRASGFIFSAFYRSDKSEGEDEYGHRINDAVSSSVHDHVINFRADLDVAGPSNNMVRLALEPITKSYNWDLPEVKHRNTMHLVEYPIVEEIGLDWPKNGGEFFIVYSANETNAWGERKGYRITSGTGMGATPHLTIINSTTLGDSARWAEHDIWVLKQKDTEPRSADPLNYLEPKTPIINFDNMADHEPLNIDEGEDLVVYFNLGSHHIPHSGDVPNTLMHTSASSVMFIPHNFHDRDPSRQSVQGVRLQLKGENSGGFAGDVGQTEGVAEDLRTRLGRRGSRESGEMKEEKGRHAKYFGATYEEGVKLELEALEPNLAEDYRSERHEVSDLSFNGSAAGMWVE
ncbi:putative copper amine oxidase [Septoria linicola]|nr:putative copper amine oxidase [Septoria linicola]